MNTRAYINKVVVKTLVAVVAAVFLAGCQRPETSPADLSELTDKQADSLLFAEKHHYSVNYNFVVKADSVCLIRQQPEEIVSRMATDTVAVYRHEHIAVADIRIIPADSIDSVWVQVARDQATFGWIHESVLLPSVVPSDPISQFISTFSDVHLLIFLITISVIAVAYLMRTIFRRNAKIVHFNDISSFYPTLLALTVATSATLYASIQTFAPDMWQHFYYHPTLNPFNVPPLLSVFLVTFWAMPIVALACVDVVRSLLPTGEAFLYLCGLAGVCAVNYIIFSLSTLYFIGYPLYAAYLLFAVRRYVTRFRAAYVCGYCGSPMTGKGRCPSCGRENY